MNARARSTSPLRNSFIISITEGRVTPSPVHGKRPRQFDARWAHERTGQHRTTSKYHSWAFDVGCWMFTWALNVECRMLNVDEHSTLNAQGTPPPRFMESFHVN